MHGSKWLLPSLQGTTSAEGLPLPEAVAALITTDATAGASQGSASRSGRKLSSSFSVSGEHQLPPFQQSSSQPQNGYSPSSTAPSIPQITPHHPGSSSSSSSGGSGGSSGSSSHWDRLLAHYSAHQTARPQPLGGPSHTPNPQQPHAPTPDQVSEPAAQPRRALQSGGGCSAITLTAPSSSGSGSGTSLVISSSPSPPALACASGSLSSEALAMAALAGAVGDLAKGTSAAQVWSWGCAGDWDGGGERQGRNGAHG